MSEIKVKNSAKNLEKSLKRLEDALNAKIDKDLKMDVVIKRFEFTFEMFWKFLRRVLEHNAIDDILLPRDILKKSFELGLIKDDQICFKMIDDRNITAHEYNIDKIEVIYPRIKKYFQVMKEDFQKITQKLKNK